MSQVNTTLYALNKNGSYQEWKVFVEGKVVTVEFGQVGGKKQYKETTCEATNVGRANERSPEDQALFEANAKWEKQYRLGYREDIEDLSNEQNFSPMLAHDASKKPHLVQYPCDVIRKLDGLRCLITFDEAGVPVFNTRGNKTYPLTNINLVSQLEFLYGEFGYGMLDGEIYIHGLPLQKIVSLAKKYRTHESIEAEIEKDYQSDIKRRDKAIKEGKVEWKNWNKEVLPVSAEPVKDVDRYYGYCSDDLEFHIFDIPQKGVKWNNDSSDKQGRYIQLQELHNIIQENEGLTHLTVLDIVTNVQTEEKVKEYIGQFMSEGYEGVIIRNHNGVYEFGQRSNDLLKWKLFKDTEAKVVDVEVDKNNEGVLHCILQNGIKFKCKMRGSHSYRLYDRQKELIGKFITVRYQQVTEDGVPQFATGVVEREVDPKTWEPLE